MRAMVKCRVLGTLGLSVLLASPAVTFAKPPRIQAGKTYCDCSCNTTQGNKALSWEKVAHCALNGSSCTADGVKGTLANCQQCVGDSSGGYASCEDAKKLTVAPPPPTPGSKLGQLLGGIALDVATLSEQLTTPDLVPLPAPASIPPEGFCRRNDQGQLLVQVYNQGRNAAGASKTIVDFDGVDPAAFDTPAVAGGTATEIVVSIPNVCFDTSNNCRFTIGVDAENTVAESEETNNNAAGLCGPQFQ